MTKVLGAKNSLRSTLKIIKCIFTYDNKKYLQSSLFMTAKHMYGSKRGGFKVHMLHICVTGQLVFMC